MKRIPTTFNYPVVYPNGVVIYCETQDEADFYRSQIYKYSKNEKREKK